jgi:hypothetical protein
VVERPAHQGLVNDLKEYVPVFAFGIGLVFGYCVRHDRAAQRGRRTRDDDARAALSGGGVTPTVTGADATSR